jgi:hypothetical protein
MARNGSRHGFVIGHLAHKSGFFGEFTTSGMEQVHALRWLKFPKPGAIFRCVKVLGRCVAHGFRRYRPQLLARGLWARGTVVARS